MLAASGTDLTVCDPGQAAVIQQRYGWKLSDAPKAALRHLVEEFKSQGNAAFRQARFQGKLPKIVVPSPCCTLKHLRMHMDACCVCTEAVMCYSRAIAGAEQDKTLFANRSAAYLAQQRFSEAIADAAKAVQLDDAWSKGHYRYQAIYLYLDTNICSTNTPPIDLLFHPRLGMANMAAGMWAKAVRAFSRGVALEPANTTMVLLCITCLHV